MPNKPAFAINRHAFSGADNLDIHPDDFMSRENGGSWDIEDAPAGHGDRLAIKPQDIHPSQAEDI